MPIRPSPKDWKPADGFVLEPAVDLAVRAMSNAIVIAGPGAGKTELLAQRACFLLQTGLCPAPRRILALSFKRDAARNLEVRVGKRCEPEYARRLESLTFESFGKTILDRFGRALPSHLRPEQHYEINFDIKEREASTLIRSLPTSATHLTTTEIESVEPIRFYREHFTAKLSPDITRPVTTAERLNVDLWRWLLHRWRPSQLNFHMIDRLAELILQFNPLILKALRSSYSFVFLDEFQDTTDIQYDLIKTAFLGTPTVLTAVGDNKQRIMGWANALKGVFVHFEQDFSATAVRPVMNYRSAPRLVAIQQVIAHALDASNEPALAHDDGSEGEGECRVLLYDNQRAEATHLAGMIEQWVKNDGVRPREICVLTRTRSPFYTDLLIAELKTRSVKARVESDVQDLLAEPLTIALLDLFKIASLPKAPSSWSASMRLLQSVCGDETDQSCRATERRLTSFITTLRTAMASVGPNEVQIRELVNLTMAFLGEAAFILQYPTYGQGNWYRKLKDLFVENMAASRSESTWEAAIADFEGVDSVPIMTMHKSKGLEYHAVVFVGLEDSALFGWERDAREEGCGFFVVLSRAKKRVIFTFSEQRRQKSGWKSQTRNKIKVLYQLLLKAGVKPENISV
jgi:DNA helicase II / ATP-dependent DNA helicase PcrA